jgi:hypothetical protein
MAARKHLAHLESVREKIQTSQIINRLNAFTLSQADPQTGRPVEMTPAQVKAGIALLKKTVPDLQVIEGSMDLHHHKHEEALGELE